MTSDNTRYCFYIDDFLVRYSKIKNEKMTYVLDVILSMDTIFLTFQNDNDIALIDCLIFYLNQHFQGDLNHSISN